MADITELLRAAAAGDDKAGDHLFQAIYQDLHRMASRRLRGQGVAELNPTVLVHETYLRLFESGQVRGENRRAFFAYVARAMRSVVVDHVRSQRALKRGGGAERVTLTTGVAGERVCDHELLVLDEALHALQKIAPSFHRLIELRYFAGLTLDEIAELDGASARTVLREWSKARAFLKELIRDGMAAQQGDAVERPEKAN